MTALIGLAQTFAITALAAAGLLMAAQFDSASPTAGSSETIATAGAGTESERQDSTGIDADTSAQSGTTFEWLDNCPAPCATACADLQRPPLDSAVDEVAAYGAAVAPEQPCVCPDAEAPAALSAETEASAENGSMAGDFGAAAEAFAGFGIGGN